MYYTRIQRAQENTRISSHINERDVLLHFFCIFKLDACLSIFECESHEFLINSRKPILYFAKFNGFFMISSKQIFNHAMQTVWQHFALF